MGKNRSGQKQEKCRHKAGQQPELGGRRSRPVVEARQEKKHASIASRLGAWQDHGRILTKAGEW